MSKKFHRSSSNVKGHFRNSTWVSAHHRSETWVREHSKHSTSLTCQRNTFSPSYTDLKGSYSYTNFFTKQETGIISRKYEKIEIDGILVLHTTFILDSNYQQHVKKIFDILKDHIPAIQTFYIDHKSEQDLKLYLYGYIEKKLEQQLIAIETIYQYQYINNFDDVVLIVLAYYLNEFNPSLYAIIFTYRVNQNEAIQHVEPREEIIEGMKKIIAEHRSFLEIHFKTLVWETVRSEFFHKHINKKFHNPKIALHMLFKKVCEDELSTLIKD